MIALLGLTAPEAIETAAQPGATMTSRPSAGGDDVLLFTSFRGNGEDGLHLAWSEDGFNSIDATMIKLDRQYALIVKDETLTPVRKHLRVAFGDSPIGPWMALTEPCTT